MLTRVVGCRVNAAIVDVLEMSKVEQRGGKGPAWRSGDVNTIGQIAQTV